MVLLAFILWVAPSLPQQPSATVTMKGHYVWIQTPRKQNAVTAVFSPQGRDAWKVSFHFTWHKKKHVYVGEAQGSLVNGELEGWVAEEVYGVIYRFKGVSKNGAFTGSHLQVQTVEGEDDLLINTGTLAMTRAEP